MELWKETAKMPNSKLRRSLETLTSKHLNREITTEEWSQQREVLEKELLSYRKDGQYIDHLLINNKFQEIFDLFTEMNIPDVVLQKSRYQSIKQYELAGGSFEAVENQLASIRLWIKEIIDNL